MKFADLFRIIFIGERAVVTHNSIKETREREIYTEPNREQIKMEARKCGMSVVLSVIILILFVQTSTVSACSCAPQHAQTTFCKSDYGKWSGAHSDIKAIIII